MLHITLAVPCPHGLQLHKDEVLFAEHGVRRRSDRFAGNPAITVLIPRLPRDVERLGALCVMSSQCANFHGGWGEDLHRQTCEITERQFWTFAGYSTGHCCSVIPCIR